MWAYDSVFYHIYPLGFCGAPHDNDGVLTHSILKIADWAYVMQTGSILMQGPGEELAANEEVKAAYLGTAK